MPAGRWVNRDALYSRPPVTLLTGFTNMYNLDIVRDEAEAEYPYRGFFFGWAREICNGEIPGCDAIFAARAKSMAQQIAKNAPTALMLTKRGGYMGMAVDVNAARHFENFAQGYVYGRKDFKEAVTARREKREPKFTGE